MLQTGAQTGERVAPFPTFRLAQSHGSHVGPRREEPGLPVHFPEMHVDQLTPKCFVCFMC